MKTTVTQITCDMCGDIHYQDRDVNFVLTISADQSHIDNEEMDICSGCRCKLLDERGRW